MRHSGVKTENDPEMKCRDAELLIIDWLASGTRSELPAGLPEHLISCNSCNRLLRSYEKGFRSIPEGRKTDPDPAFYDNLVIAMQHQHGHKSHTETNPRRLLKYSPAMTAAAASVILGVWIGSRLIYPAMQVNNVGEARAVADGSMLFQEYADDLNPDISAALLLEGYLTDNENTGSDDTE